MIPGWQEQYAVPKTSIRGVILTSDIFDMNFLFYDKSGAQEVLKMSVEDARRCSPLYHLPERKFPVIIAYGEKEPEGFLVEAKEYAKAL